MPHRRRRRRQRAHISIVVLISLLIGAAATGGLGLLAKSQADSLQAHLIADVQSGQSELEAAKTSLKLANSNHDPKQVDAAKAHFAAAKSKFAAAIQQADHSLVLRGLESMPAAGSLVRSRHTAVDGIAAMGSALADAGRELADLDAKLLKPPSSGTQQGQVLLAVLTNISPHLDTIRGDLQRADDAAATVDAGVLPAAQRPTFVKARGAIHTALASFAELKRLAPVLVEMLGGNGLRTYLIEQVNPAELRPGGGFIGSYSLLKADHGSIQLVKSGSSYELAASRASPGQPGYVAPPGPLHEFVPTASWSFVDSNFFADFANNALAAEQFVAPQLKTPVDGVLAMDYYAVAAMLKVTGPLTVPQYSVTVDAANFVATLMGYDLEQTYVHKAILPAIAAPLFQRILTMPPGQWPNMLSALTEVVAQRHLQAYFNNALVEAEMNSFGWSGALNPTRATDCMLEEESNLGGTKANFFVTRSYTVYLTRVGDMLHHKVAIDLTDSMPKKYQQNLYYPVNVYYHPYMRLYVCGGVSAGTNNLVRPKYPSPGAPPGLKVLDGWLPAIDGGGAHGQAIFEYDTPWHADDQGVGHLYWQKQPGTGNDKIDVIWVDGRDHGMYTTTGALSQDQIINLGPNGVTLTAGQPAQAKIPTISL